MNNLRDKYQVVIGLEVHAQLSTNTLVQSWPGSLALGIWANFWGPGALRFHSGCSSLGKSSLRPWAVRPPLAGAVGIKIEVHVRKREVSDGARRNILGKLKYDQLALTLASVFWILLFCLWASKIRVVCVGPL